MISYGRELLFERARLPIGYHIIMSDTEDFLWSDSETPPRDKEQIDHSAFRFSGDTQENEFNCGIVNAVIIPEGLVRYINHGAEKDELTFDSSPNTKATHR